ncbi:myristylated tegument protein [Cercopithecine betaherpesvirus 5]|uniref:Cytoplasmic envelopment protein 3 n=1 Tax=Simian cytomegalovirus (strain Colburn) TaxID=50292 RepID=G8XTG1_SCMVC|nr:myristylated tegument protein [Cercopithecine betaherpesvirus 5]AEV80453.1 myristylated tegument protein [Cercopithecine betaherpesvirus 5]
MGSACCKRICCFFGASARQPLRDAMGRPVCLKAFNDMDNTSDEEEEADLISISSDRVSLASHDSTASSSSKTKKKKKKKEGEHRHHHRRPRLALMEEDDEEGYHSPSRLTKTRHPSPSTSRSPCAQKLASRPPTPKPHRTPRLPSFGSINSSPY